MADAALQNATRPQMTSTEFKSVSQICIKAGKKCTKAALNAPVSSSMVKSMRLWHWKPPNLDAADLSFFFFLSLCEILVLCMNQNLTVKFKVPPEERRLNISCTESSAHQCLSCGINQHRLSRLAITRVLCAVDWHRVTPVLAIEVLEFWRVTCYCHFMLLTRGTALCSNKKTKYFHGWSLRGRKYLYFATTECADLVYACDFLYVCIFVHLRLWVVWLLSSRASV